MTEPRTETADNPCAIKFRQKSVQTAGKLLDDFEKSSEAFSFIYIRNLLVEINQHLKLGHADASVLDPEGKRITRALDKAYLTSARYIFDQLEKGAIRQDPCEIINMAADVRQFLALARMDAAALDRTGESTTDMMERRFLHAVTKNHFDSAFHHLSEIRKMIDNYLPHYSTQDVIAETFNNLRCVESIVDAMGSRTLNGIEARTAKIGARRHLIYSYKSLAKFELMTIGQAPASADQAFIDARLNLAAAAAGLDEPGQDTSQEIMDVVQTVAAARENWHKSREMPGLDYGP
jgi:hypothetical protein